MLRALVLALHYDSSREMCNAHSRVSRIDMLTTRASRAIGIDAQVLVVDIDFNVFVDFRINKEGGK